MLGCLLYFQVSSIHRKGLIQCVRSLIFWSLILRLYQRCFGPENHDRFGEKDLERQEEVGVPLPSKNSWIRDKKVRVGVTTSVSVYFTSRWEVKGSRLTDIINLGTTHNYPEKGETVQLLVLFTVSLSPFRGMSVGKVFLYDSW